MRGPNEDDEEVGKIAVTHLGQNGQPDHTVFSYGGIRHSYDSDKGQNIRNEHYAENGVKGSAVTPSSPPRGQTTKPNRVSLFLGMEE